MGTFVTFFFSAIVAGLVAFIVCHFNSSPVSSTAYKELIAAERIKRLNSLRQCMVDYLAKSYYILNLKYDSEKDYLGTEQNSAEVAQLSFLLKLVLNPQQKAHQALVAKLSELDELAPKLLSMAEDIESLFALYEYKIVEFSKMCQDVLRDEWDIIKPDAAVNEAIAED